MDENFDDPEWMAALQSEVTDDIRGYDQLLDEAAARAQQKGGTAEAGTAAFALAAAALSLALCAAFVT
jgi:hypothetical protein